MWSIAKKRLCGVILTLFAIVFAGQGAFAERAPIGSMIGSEVIVSFEVIGVSGTLTSRSNIPLVRVLPRPTSSRLTLLRLSEGAQSGVPVLLGNVAFSSDLVNRDGFRAQAIDGFDPSVPVMLDRTDSFLPGEVIFFHLSDEGLNHRADLAEVAYITLEGANGDREILRLEAAGPDSSDFYGYALAVDASMATPGDGKLATASNTPVGATYRDEFDATDVAVASALFDPRIMLFDAESGAPVDGAVLSVIDTATDEVAAVMGLDAAAEITTPIVSGSPIADARGRVYVVGSGEARIPYLPAGSYRIDVNAPPGYVYASDTPDEQIAAIPNHAFRLSEGSRGQVFELIDGGTPRFDIPLDPRESLHLTKTVDSASAAPGDFIRYQLILENNDDRATTGTVINDVLPFGVRYVPGSMRLGGVELPDPAVAENGVDLVHRLDDMLSGARREYTYVARIGTHARYGDASSTARARAVGGFRSNRAEVVTTVVDDLLSRQGTVLGRVVVGECGAPGKGVRARLLLETGRVIVTDDKGRFHGDDLSPKRHALRLDEHSLPDDLVPHACPGDLRPGETATARTLDIRGGLLRQLIFRLRRVESAEEEVISKAPAKREEWTEERLADLPKELAILYPLDGESMKDPSLSIGIAYPYGRRIKLMVNGEVVSNLSSNRTIANRDAGMAMRRWHGIDLADGPTLVEATISDAKGREIARLSQTVHYVTDPARAEVLPDLSTLVADGQSSPVIAIRITDSAGRPVHSGRRVPVSVDPPYQTSTSFARFTDDPLIERDSTLSVAEVGEDGVALLRLRPTVRAGEVSMTMRLGTREKPLRAWLVPAPRPWIVVGLAEGTVGYNTVSGNMVDADALEAADLKDKAFNDGRVAFYAKGAIRGDWLLTLAYDSDGSRNPRTRDFFDEIDPTTYYPVYADASTQEQAAPTRYPLYVRLERGQFFAMFGDYRTGLDRNELTAYDRTLSGFKTVYEGDRVQVIAFAAEADQQFQRVELLADRGVGPYDLGAVDILRNSEEVRYVVRGRERLDTVLTSRTLARFVDYMVNYETGELELTAPPDPTDEAFNPGFLVVDFETESPDPGRVTAGGRAAVKLLGNRLEIGASAVHEEGAGIASTGDLVGVDVRAKITEDIDVIGEVAASRVEEDGETRDGMAYRAQGVYAGKDWRARVYIQQADTDFGVAQQTVGTRGRRTYGIEAQASIVDPLADPEAVNPDKYALTGKITSDEDLGSDARRDMVETLVSRPISYGKYGKGTLGLGYRAVADRLLSGETRQAHQAVGRAGISVLDGRVTMQVERKQTIVSSGANDEPSSTLARVEARVTERIRATAGIETFDGESIGSGNLHAGLAADPWKGATVSVGVTGTQDTFDENAERIAGTVGVAQDFKIGENTSITLRANHIQRLGGSQSPVTDSLFSQFQPVADATTGSVGLGRTGNGWSASVRVDLRYSEESESQRVSVGAIGDITDSLTLAAGGSVGNREADATGTTQSADLTIGAAYRPLSGRFTALHRMDARFDSDNSERITLVNTLALEGKPTEWLTLAGTYGIRVRLQEIMDRDYESVTQFLGADAYMRVRENWDLGLHGSALASLEGDAVYAYGASVGYSPRPGMTFRLGFNADGFEDEDFSEANITAQGVYVRLTLRFDESDIRSLLPDMGWIDAFRSRNPE